MAAKRDYYEVLGVARSASDDEIKKAYKRAAMKFHPDRNPGDKKAEESFKEANEAYEILSNAQKRSAYDQFGHAGIGGAAGGGAGPGFGGFGAGLGDIFGDVFSDIFGGAAGGARRGPQSFRGADLRYHLEVDLETAAHGDTVRIQVPTWASCETCKGSGAAPGSSPTTCPTCRGNGQVRMQQGFFAIQQTCPQCRGHGKVITNPCKDCRGQGRQQKTKVLSVKIPAGVDTGDRIRLAGEGEAGEMGGAPGDLYVQIEVKAHPLFMRDGNDLQVTVPISFVTAAVGGELEVPTLEGKAVLKIPAETQSDRVFRLRGKGVKNVRGGGQGDLLCRVQVETPVRLTSRQKELLHEFGRSLEEGGERHSPQSSSWVDKAKRFFEGRVKS